MEILLLLGTVIVPIFVVVVMKVVLDAISIQFTSMPFPHLSWFWAIMLMFFGIVLAWVTFDVESWMAYVYAYGTLVAVPILLILALVHAVSSVYRSLRKKDTR